MLLPWLLARRWSGGGGGGGGGYGDGGGDIVMVRIFIAAGGVVVVAAVAAAAVAVAVAVAVVAAVVVVCVVASAVVVDAELLDEVLSNLAQSRAPAMTDNRTRVDHRSSWWCCFPRLLQAVSMHDDGVAMAQLVSELGRQSQCGGACSGALGAMRTVESELS